MSARRTRTPALDAWRRELAEGKRDAHTFDSVWAAACAELNALEADAAGLGDAAAAYRHDVARAAAHERRAGQAEAAGDAATAARARCEARALLSRPADPACPCERCGGRRTRQRLRRREAVP